MTHGDRDTREHFPSARRVGLLARAPDADRGEPHSAPGRGRAVGSFDKTVRIAHVIFRLDVGGLEIGLAELINCMPADRYRHTIVCLTCYTDFRKRIEKEVPVYAMGDRLGRYAINPRPCSDRGQLSRERVERGFSLDGMVKRYTEVYDGLKKDLE